MKFEIDNVPLPSSRPDTVTATVKALNVGQSFLIPSDEVKPNTQKGLATIARRAGVKVLTRTVDNGLRVWRVDNVVNEAEIVEDEEPITQQEKIANLRDIVAGIESGHNPFVQPETVAEWVFTKDSPQYADDGNVYRLQKLVPDYKRSRKVQVDEDYQDTIIKVV